MDILKMDNFTTNILNVYKDKGKKWLTDLPTIIKALASEYNLSGLKPLNNLSYNYVLSGFLGNRPIILKLGLDNDALKQEASSLQAFDGFGGIKVLVAKKGFLLLEKAIPGISLKSYFPLQDNDSYCYLSFNFYFLNGYISNYLYSLGLDCIRTE